ncbi:hypothetical protein ABZP36_011267 [Zizania latifolia]
MPHFRFCTPQELVRFISLFGSGACSATRDHARAPFLRSEQPGTPEPSLDTPTRPLLISLMMLELPVGAISWDQPYSSPAAAAVTATEGAPAARQCW